jgi:hypothetical protein
VNHTAPAPPRIAITGAAGFLGWHLRCAIRMRGWPDPVWLDRTRFEDPAVLLEALAGIEVVVHLAGVNRGPEAEVEAGNPRLARTLVAALDGCASTRPTIANRVSRATRDIGRARQRRQRRVWATHKHIRQTRDLLPTITRQSAPRCSAGRSTCNAA